MSNLSIAPGMQVFVPDSVGAGASPNERIRAVLPPGGLNEAKAEISSWPDYRPTPMISLAGLAKTIGVAELHYKNEAARFGLNSFKALGGAYAVLRLLKRRIGPDVTSIDLRSGRYRTRTDGFTVCCATDGNHGRSVAWGANQFGVRCVIYLHAQVSRKRAEAIAQYGAEIRRVPGNYDAAVRQAKADAGANDWFVVSDTSYPGYMDIPRDVMQGYTVMIDEAADQLDAPPTHCFVQGGVGGLAAAALAQLWERYGVDRPKVIVVEPEKAACLYESARAGQPTAITGDIDTLMAGLACGEVSLLAWEVLQGNIDAYLTITDEAAADTMRLLANGVAGDEPLVAGESAVAGLAGLIIARGELSYSRALDLDESSRILLLGSEGATDLEIYERIVGRPASQIESRRCTG
jgi:diaminopropionate ammonia-lyase